MQSNGGAADFIIEPKASDPSKFTIKTIDNYWSTYPPIQGFYSATYRLQIKSTDANGAGRSTNSNTFVIVVNVQGA